MAPIPVPSMPDLPPPEPMPEPSPSPMPALTGQRGAVQSIDGRVVRLRQTPSIYGPELGIYANASTVTLNQRVQAPSEETQGATTDWWLVTTDDGNQGYMRAAEVTPIPNTGTSPAATMAGYAYNSRMRGFY